MILEESMKAEINKQCPELATKKGTHIFGPPSKNDMHVLWGQVQVICMGRLGAGSAVTGTAVTPACPHRRRFCIAFLFLQVGVLAMRGGNRSQDGTGHSKKKKPTHLERGKRGKATPQVVWHWGQGRCGTTQLVGDGAVMLVCPRHRRFLCCVLQQWACWQWEGWWQMSGLVRIQQKKRATHLERGGRRLGQYSIRDGHGKTQQVSRT